MRIVTSADREPPKDKADAPALCKSMMAYSGKYRIEAENKIHHERRPSRGVLLGTAQSRPGSSSSTMTCYRSRRPSKPTGYFRTE
jgi:hypothetical protein